MRATFCAIGFAISIGSALSQVKTPAPLTILYRFEAAHSPAVFQEMQRESGTLLESLGFRPDWLNRSDPAATAAFPDLVVIDFRGRCVAEAADLPTRGKNSFARTPVEDGRVLPFTEVECDRVRASLRSASDVALGRALGRVLAHELYHILKQTKVHASQGVARNSLSRTELVSNRLEFR